MHLNRWTCLATAILTTAIGPIANVQANTLSSSSVNFGRGDTGVLPQSLPIITPLVATELETDLMLPVKIQPVPLVSKLPVMKPLRYIHGANRSMYRRLAKGARGRKFNVAKLKLITPITLISSTTTRIIPQQVLAIPPILPVARLTTNVLVPTNSQLLTSSANITATAEQTKLNNLLIDSSPQVATLASIPTDRSDIPAFVGGIPVFGISKEQTPQVVNTVIAQFASTNASPEPSIAIPIKQPQQSIVPAKLPVGTMPSATEPTGMITTDKIVATQSGQASWYGSEGGSQTASGEKYNPRALTAAHRTLPFGTKVRITSVKTGKAVTVRINDRGPFHSRRIIDVSAGAAEVIGIKDAGIGDVRLEVLGREG